MRLVDVVQTRLISNFFLSFYGRCPTALPFWCAGFGRLRESVEAYGSHSIHVWLLSVQRCPKVRFVR